jgi:hypothetical protein
MAQNTKKSSETLNDLFKRYGLVYDPDNKKDSDVFVNKHYKIITRSGVEKIQASLNIAATYKEVYVDPYWVALKGIFTYTDESGQEHTLETYGEASIDRKEYVLETVTQHKEEYDATNKVIITKKGSSAEAEEYTTVKGNVQQQPAYLFAMAEKRAKARGILQLAGLYAHNVYSEDEAEDFGKAVKREREI